MIRLLKNRYALATVITTLIILVVAILLAGVVTYFAINVVSTRVQQESLLVSQAHIWVPATAATGAVEGALMITNTGGRDVVINQIQVRGQPCTTVFYLDAVAADSTSGALSTELTWVDPTTGGTPTLAGQTVGTGATAFTNPLAAAPTNLVLPTGNTIVVYISGPDSVTINDIGLTIGFTVFTAQAMYYKETNVQAYTGT